METVLFGNLKKLYDCELWTSVITAASLLNTYLQNDRTKAKADHQVLEYQSALFLANALYHERQFRQAGKHFEGALLMRKSLVRHKSIPLTAIENTYDQFTEVEIRYRLAKCHIELNENNLAITVLQAVPLKKRLPKINMQLAKLLHHGRSANAAETVAAYKEVLRECPIALDAIDALLQLGVDDIEVNSQVVNASSITKNIEWLSGWIKAHAQLYTRKHLEASKTFKLINENTKFHQNEHLVTLIGKCLYYHGNFSQAQHYLETALIINPSNIEAMMALAVVYEYNQNQAELEKMASRLTQVSEFSSAHWFVLGENFFASGKPEKASSFALKATALDQRNVEAQLLRGKISLHLKRPKEAVQFFRAAQCYANYRFEVYKGLFHCYVGLKRLKEAQTMCALAVRYFRHTPRSYVMFARTLFHSSDASAKKSARKVVSKALQIDNHYPPAVALMAEVCRSEGQLDEATELLRKQVENYPHHKLFTMLADILRAKSDLSGALEYYTVALSMDPSYNRALSGVNALGNVRRSYTAKRDEDVSKPAYAPDGEWPDECENAVNVSISQDGGAFTEPYWPDIEAEITN